MTNTCMRVFVQPLSFFERGVVRKRSALALIKLCSILVCQKRTRLFHGFVHEMGTPVAISN